jgi:cytochrome c-type biogenesis protein CcmH/NrfG
MSTHDVTPCDALYAAGHYMLERSRVEDAAVLFRTMLLADAADERGWLALGACHEQLEQLAMAEELYAAGAQMARTKVRCLLAAARVFSQLDDDRADEVLEQAERFARTDEEVELVEREMSRRKS